MCNANDPGYAGSPRDRRAPEAPPSPATPNNLSPPSNDFLAALRESHDEGAHQISTPQRVASPSLLQPSSGIRKPAHNRTVSWGMSSTSPAPPPSESRMRLISWDKGTQGSSQRNKLGINDVVNVVGHTELEAETYILKAVEKITVHNRNNTEVSGLYSAIVEDEVSNLASLSFETQEEEEEEEETGYEGDEPKPRPTPSKQSSRATLTSSRFQSFRQKPRVESKTVEGTLFGLTSALAEMDNKDTIHRTDSADRDEAEVPDTNFTSADKLANAANKMLNEKKDDDVETSLPSFRTKKGEGMDPSEDRKKNQRKSGSRVVQGASKGVKQEWELFNNYFTTRKDRVKSFTKKLLWLILIPSFALAFFLFYIVENPDLCPVNKRNGTVAPTNPPTMAPSGAPSSAPSVSPTSLPSTMPSSYPSKAPTAFDLFSIAWLENGTAADTDALNDTVPYLNDTMDADGNDTIAPIEVEEEEEEPPNIFEILTVCPGLGASASWWVLFLGVRHVLVLTMAFATQSIVIDFLALSSRVMLNIVGPVVTLLVVQSKGWPFILTFWAIYSLILLCGDTEYAHHWGYWQDWIGIFNKDNPSGDVVNNELIQEILVNAIIVGVAVAIKRLTVGLLLGRQTFAHFGEQLAAVMKNMVLVGEVATLARHIEDTQEDYQDTVSLQPSLSESISGRSKNWNTKNIQKFVRETEDDIDADDDDEPFVASAADAANAFIATRSAEKPTPEIQTVASHDSCLSSSNPEFTESQQQEMAELLDAWEEPQTTEEKEERKITIGAVLQFRSALSFMKKKYPFLPAFGPADTREACITSSQLVYDRLLLRTPRQGVLPFETLALLAKKEDGTIDKEKAKELIRAFRPDRDGTLGKLEWVKSVDVIYKELRLLSANISNSSQMDAAVEHLINIIFYIGLAAIIVYRFGEDPLSLFLSFSSVILAFAFMIGKSASKYFDGCLFILCQRPYGVGDRVHLSNPQNETDPAGSSGWIVEKVSLFTTSVYWGTTNERATLCNGAISSLRVINAARSPNATIFVELKFGIDTEYEKIEIFRTAVEQYLKDRPREWLTFVAFRPSEVAPEKGYIGYKVIAQHRNSWQVIGGVIESKANLTTYCLEVSKQLEMRFLSPPLPVDLTMKGDAGLSIPRLGEDPMEAEGVTGYAGVAPRTPQTPEGLRHRRGKSRFAELVSMALEANKKK